MSKKSSSKEDYGSPLPKKASPHNQMILGSPSYISKITTPITSLKGKGAYTALVSPSQFSQGITASPSSKLTPKRLPYYTPPPGAKSKFITKEFSVPIIPLEESYCPPGESLLQIVSNVFPYDTHFLQADINKTRKYYEFILVDTDSITLTHVKDSNDQNLIKFSKFKINKVLSPEEWGRFPYHSRDLSREFIPQSYNYLDYMDAWSHFLTVRPYDHTWFIWFNKNISLKFPSWFIKWFEVYGLEEKIFPDYVTKSYKEFQEITDCPKHKDLLSFTAIFGITWIMSWSYVTDTIWPEATSSHLSRNISIKWWDTFNPDLLSPTVRNAWYAKNPKLCKHTASVITPSMDASFLADKSKMLASLSAISDPQKFAKKLQEITGALSDCHSSSSSIEVTPVNLNEDDCYGIFD